MTRTIRITRFDLSARFRTEFHAAPENVRTAAEKALRLLEQNPGARSLRLHTLKGTAKPTVWKIDVLSNHSWQIAFELNGEVALLKRIGTHASIDRNPR